MGKNQAQRVTVHPPDPSDLDALAEQVDRAHLAVITERLRESDFTTEQKIAVLDRILELLHVKEKQIP